RIGHEIERRERRDARLDAHLLDAERHEDGPDDVGQLRGGKQDRERRPRRGALRGEAQGKMPDEHSPRPLHRSYLRSPAGGSFLPFPVVGTTGCAVRFGVGSTLPTRWMLPESTVLPVSVSAW